MEATTAERHASGGPSKGLHAQNLALAFKATVDRIPDDPAIVWGEDDDERVYSWREISDQTGRIAGGLASLGVSKGDTVALMLNNRPEFMPCDLAAVSLGAVPFSIYQTSSPEQIRHVVADAGAKVAIVETAFLEVFSEARSELPEVETLIVIDGPGGDHTLESLEQVDPGFDVSESVAAVDADDLLTLIYTSGTTGPPKGVQLTHRNLMTLTAGVEDIVHFPERGAKVISWLPAAHIAERGAHYYLPVIRGCSVTICPDPRKIVEWLPKVRPTWFFAVPRIWEKLKAGLEAKMSAIPGEDGDKARAGLEAALKKVELEQAGEEVPDELAAGVAAADEAMFSHLRTALGLDEAIAVNVGAAPTPVEVLAFFHAIGIPIGELWGMSETCGAATVNPPGKVKLGTVGPPLPGVEIKLADDGEVLIRGDLIMAGYRNLPGKDSRGTRRGRLALHGRHRRARRGRLSQDRRSQEGADHQRRRQEHVAGEHRVAPEVGEPLDRASGRDRRQAPLQRRLDRARPRLRARMGEAERPRGQIGRGPRGRGGDAGGGPGRRRRGEREDGARRADQEVQGPADRLGARRRRVDADDEAQAQADRREVRRRDRRALRQVATAGAPGAAGAPHKRP